MIVYRLLILKRFSWQVFFLLQAFSQWFFSKEFLGFRAGFDGPPCADNKPQNKMAHGHFNLGFVVCKGRPNGSGLVLPVKAGNFPSAVAIVMWHSDVASDAVMVIDHVSEIIRINLWHYVQFEIPLRAEWRVLSSRPKRVF